MIALSVPLTLGWAIILITRPLNVDNLALFYVGRILLGNTLVYNHEVYHKCTFLKMCIIKLIIISVISNSVAITYENDQYN